MELPHVGEHCSEKSCNRLDFLPMKCDSCGAIFCRDHVTYDSHNCPSAYKKDVQVPVCPLCNVPVPTKRGDPPDLAVSKHIDNECQSDIGRSKIKVFVNKCTYKGCKIREVVPVRCSQCRENFCLKHRHPQDHVCSGRDEAMRRKRLEAVTSSNAKNNNNVNGNKYGNIQGYMSEDEALARALQASLNDEKHSRRQELQPVPSSSRDKCLLS